MMTDVWSTKTQKLVRVFTLQLPLLQFLFVRGVKHKLERFVDLWNGIMK